MNENSEIPPGQGEEAPEPVVPDQEQDSQASPVSEQTSPSSDGTRVLVDPRGQRFNAAISVVVLAAVLVAGVTSNLAAILLTIQGAAFGLGAMFGLRFQPYGWFYRRVIRPRMGAPTHYEAESPPRFAQLVGFIFVVVALFCVVMELTVLAYVFVALALVAAFLNAAFGFCLGCQLYLTFKRITSK